MKCTICDKCKKIIERPDQVRTITCTRPMKKMHHDDERERGATIDKRQNDIVWQRELCMECADATEAFLEPSDSGSVEEPDDDGGDEEEAGEEDPEHGA